MTGPDLPPPNYLAYARQPEVTPAGTPADRQAPLAPPPRSSGAVVLVALLALLVVTLLVFAALTFLSQPQGLDPEGDEDGDGVVNRIDPFPTDPDEWADLDGDGVGDNQDPDDDGDGVNDTLDLDPRRDLAIHFTLQWANLTTPIGRRGQADLFLELWSNLSGEMEQLTTFDNDGHPLQLPWQTRTELDWEVVVNVPDDQSLDHLNLRAYEVDRWTPVLLDIDGNDPDTSGLTIYYDLLNGTWQGDDSTGELDGALDNVSNENDARLGYTIETVDFGYTVSFTWYYQGQRFELVHRFDPSNYNGYVSSSHRIDGYADFITYATPADPEVQAVAARLADKAEVLELDAQERANFVLSFVQGLTYSQDNLSAGIGEYPRYPVETLVDQRGDCEDTALLYISLLSDLGYDTALFILPDATPQAGHAATGVALDPYTGEGAYYTDSGLDYYYAETTAQGWLVGQMPPLDDSKAYIYPLAPIGDGN